jgi:hypothetical protein
MDGGEHRDPKSEQGQTGYKPEGNEALPTVVDSCRVMRLRIVPPSPMDA